MYSMSYESLTKDFLGKSYKNLLRDYQVRIAAGDVFWDWIILTSSNEIQAEAYRIQFEERRECGFIPQKTNFAVVPDFEGKRVGSGGATMSVIKYLCERGIDFEHSKILVIHSGGDSRRLPQYSASGKLFSPVPRMIEKGRRSCLFDELILLFSQLASQCEGGMLILPSDTLFNFNPINISLRGKNAAAISIKTSAEEGKDHGVFVTDENSKMTKFLHKRPLEELRTQGAISKQQKIDIDTGCIWLGSEVVLGLSRLFVQNNIINLEIFRKYVNDLVRLNLYSDIVLPLAKDVTLESYLKETPEGGYSEELSDCRKNIWSALKPFELEVIKVSPAEYLHFGSTPELKKFVVHEIDNYSHLGWAKEVNCFGAANFGSSYNTCVIPNSAIISDDVYIEDSIIGENVVVGEGSILSNIDVDDNTVIPSNVVLHLLKLQNNAYVCRVYGVLDNPKNSISATFLGSSIKTIFDKYCIDLSTHVDKESPASIWNTRLFCECVNKKEAIDMALTLIRMSYGTASEDEVKAWKSYKKASLESSFNEADLNAIMEWQSHISMEVKVMKSVEMMDNHMPIEECLHELDIKSDVDAIIERIREEAERASCIKKMKLYLLASMIYERCKNDIENAKEMENKAYAVLRNDICNCVSSKYVFDCGAYIVREGEIIQRMPARVNFAGSPSDAAPYCIEHGGTMLNAAISLNGELPIVAKVRKTNTPALQFVSEDQSLISEPIHAKRDLYTFDNLEDPFALHKAAFVVTGVLEKWNDLVAMFSEIGGGLVLSTEANIPKGSGLGTSSILLAALVKALNIYFGQSTEDDKICAQVFAAEQMMSTGGGWQDQAGAVKNGIKYIYSKPGIEQNLISHEVVLPEEACRELEERFALIFSGQRRLAKNVLRKELNSCLINENHALEKVMEIRKSTAMMRFDLEVGDITGFGMKLKEQFCMIKQLDEMASNDFIEYIFSACEDLLDGYTVCGAGGGGFLQVILKKGVSRSDLKHRLEEIFQESDVTLWESSFIYG